MPIEMWWWMMPLMKTAIALLFPFGVLLLILVAVLGYEKVPVIFFIIPLLPWALLILAFFAWLAANLGVYIIAIWRDAYA